MVLAQLDYGNAEIEGLEVIMIPAWYRRKKCISCRRYMCFRRYEAFCRDIRNRCCSLANRQYFTADVKQAIEACKLIKPNIENVEKLGVKAIILKPGKNRNIKHKILLRRRMF